MEKHAEFMKKMMRSVPITQVKQCFVIPFPSAKHFLEWY